MKYRLYVKRFEKTKIVPDKNLHLRAVVTFN